MKYFKVVKVLEGGARVVINAGQQSIRKTDRFVIFQLGEEILDPDTNKSLGKLEIIRGEAKPLHIQETMTTLEGIEILETQHPNPFGITDVIKEFLAKESGEKTRPKKFYKVEKGDLVKKI